MNEKIKEFARHSEVDAGYIPRYDMWQLDTESLEKFAELIIRECIQACGCRVASNQGYNTGRMHCVSDIKDHFGLK